MPETLFAVMELFILFTHSVRLYSVTATVVLVGLDPSGKGQNNLSLTRQRTLPHAVTAYHKL